MKSYSIQEINEVIKGTIVGETSIIITAPEQLEFAGSSEISFIGNKIRKVLGNFQSLCGHSQRDISIQPAKTGFSSKCKMPIWPCPKSWNFSRRPLHYLALIFTQKQLLKKRPL